MFGDLAEKVANKLHNDKITSTQFRQFYDKVLELNNKAQSSPDDFDSQVLPFVKMLKSKVAYSHSRNHSGDHFKVLMDTAIGKVNTAEELQNFKYFLESIIGFMPQSKGKNNADKNNKY